MDRDTKLRLSSLGTTCHGVLRMYLGEVGEQGHTYTYIHT